MVVEQKSRKYVRTRAMTKIGEKYRWKWNKRKTIYLLILLIGIATRFFRFGITPGGINQDEAFAAREAWSLLHFGVDSFGYHWPMYLTAWGSGMNVWNTILMIPAIAIFGQHTWVFRLPQLIVGITTLMAVEKIVKETIDEEVALWAMFLLAINPWHIMMSRWGLESNLAPGFLIFGLLFFIQGMKSEKYYLLSALFYGMSLYCYATIWPIVPFIVLFQAAYLLYVKKAQITKWTISAGVILGILAIPAILFLLVNKGVIAEIVTPCFSVPKLVVMRDSEITLTELGEKLENMVSILVTENDGYCWNSTDKFGLYYKYFLIFAVIGLLYCIRSVYRSLKNRIYDGYVLIGIQFLTAFALGTLIDVNVNRINCIHISIIIFMAVGICRTLNLLRRDLKYITEVAVIALCALFLFFEKFYFGVYAKDIGRIFQDGIENAVYRAQELSDDGDTIYVGEGIMYPKILAFSTLSPTEYMETVEYTNYPDAFLDISQCGNFVFNTPLEGDDGIYIIDLTKQTESCVDMGYTVEQFGNMAVVYK